MNLRQALSISEFRKARISKDGWTTVIEQVGDGYHVSYSGKEKHFRTFDGLAVWLTDEVVNAQWTPIQEDN